MFYLFLVSPLLIIPLGWLWQHYHPRPQATYTYHGGWTPTGRDDRPLPPPPPSLLLDALQKGDWLGIRPPWRTDLMQQLTDLADLGLFHFPSLRYHGPILVLMRDSKPGSWRGWKPTRKPIMTGCTLMLWVTFQPESDQWLPVPYLLWSGDPARLKLTI